MSRPADSLFRRLARGVARDLDNERFVAMVRNTVAVAFVFVVSSELAALVSPAFPRDVVGTLADLGLPGFYVLSFYSLAMVGIMARTRLKRSEREARDELERLNTTLRSEVEAQVARIRRAETLSRYLPPELSEQVLASDTGDALAHGHRNLAV